MLTTASTAHMTKTELNFVRLSEPTSRILLKISVQNIFTEKTKSEKTHAVFIAAICEPLTIKPTQISSIMADPTWLLLTTDPLHSKQTELDATDYMTVQAIKQHHQGASISNNDFNQQ